MFDPTNYPAGIYDDTVPSDSKFYVSIKPMDADFIREDYVIDEDEFTIVSIIGEIGEGDDITYEVQFVDDHITMVCLSFPISSDDSNDPFSYLSANCFVIKMQKRRSRNIKLGAKVADDHEDNEKKQNHFKHYPTLMQVIWIPHLMNGLINDEELSFEDHLKEHAQIQEDQKLDQPGLEDSSVWCTMTMKPMIYLTQRPQEGLQEWINDHRSYGTMIRIFQMATNLKLRQ